jgi:hypothetical protein
VPEIRPVNVFQVLAHQCFRRRDEVGVTDGRVFVEELFAPRGLFRRQIKRRKIVPLRSGRRSNSRESKNGRRQVDVENEIIICFAAVRCRQARVAYNQRVLPSSIVAWINLRLWITIGYS